ncbi:MAG: hypothetical protein ACXWMB_01790 [Candidatus Limnocylindria bacterium]
MTEGKVTPATLIKVSVDLRIAIDKEGRLPQAVIMIFPEPTKPGEVVARVNEYVRTERTNRIVDAIARETRPAAMGARGYETPESTDWAPNDTKEPGKNGARRRRKSTSKVDAARVVRQRGPRFESSRARHASVATMR